jgi:glycosyltransferase involved in cell wall biosynthesis
MSPTDAGKSPAGREPAGHPLISVIIPNYNGAGTIGMCLDALYSSQYDNYEVIVVDDCSGDNSVEVIKQYPCKLVRLEKHGGASKTRNTGAANARGDALFFIDADCVVLPDTLEIADRAFREHNGTVVGGTYTPVPYDNGFFSRFQSVFVNYSETRLKEPDYVATHAMLIGRETFEKSGGFDEDFLPILEDVEFSHRLKRSGIRLVMCPELTVRHIFNFNLARSLRNAVRKSMYWTMYSIRNRDLLSDSGTASMELKTNGASWLLCVLLVAAFVYSGSNAFLIAAPGVIVLNLLVNRKFMAALFKAGGPAFALGAMLYYTSLYPAAVSAGGLLGVVRRG